MSFKFEMNAKVSNAAGEIGTVVGRAEYVTGERECAFLRDGEQDRAQTKWLSENELTAA